MPSPFALYPFQIGDRVTMKKPHPCGGFIWVVIRVGADIALRCETCSHLTVLARQPLEKRTKKVEHPPAQPSSGGPAGS